MPQTRTLVLGSLLLLPVLLYLIVGGYALWTSGLAVWIWWCLPVLWLATWVIARVWPARPVLFEASAPDGRHWTPRDRQAAEIVRRYQQKVDSFNLRQLTDPHHFFEEMKSLSLELAKHYYPKSEHPIEAITLPELLAALRLALGDVERWSLTALPGSRLLTIGQWRSLQHAPKWARRVQDMTWAAWILMNPANLGLYFSSKYTTEPVASDLQTELLVLLYVRSVRQIGFYLIEMNSGRLRGGADEYLAALGDFQTQASTLQQPRAKPDESAAGESDAIEADASASNNVVVALVGQTGAGKSSLINAMTGKETTRVDILPSTRAVQRVQLQLEKAGVELVLLDTPGYGEVGASQEQIEQIHIALQEAHVALLVLDAHSPARNADQAVLNELKEWYGKKPQLKPPPILGVLTHVDLLPPSLEWKPPYDWQHASSKKAQQIAQAIEYTQQVLGAYLSGVVPVCASADEHRQWGVAEELIPALTQVLDDAHSVAILRAFEQQLDGRKFRTLLKQISTAGRALVADWINKRLTVARR